MKQQLYSLLIFFGFTLYSFSGYALQPYQNIIRHRTPAERTRAIELVQFRKNLEHIPVIDKSFFPSNRSNFARYPGDPQNTAAVSKIRTPLDSPSVLGQFTVPQFLELRELAMKRQGTLFENTPIVFSGSLGETSAGLNNRYFLGKKTSPSSEIEDHLKEIIPVWRFEKFESDLVEHGKIHDIDLWEGSVISKQEEQQIKEILGIEDEALFDTKGYRLERYPSIEVFHQKGGAVVFYPDGSVGRLNAPWQHSLVPD